MELEVRGNINDFSRHELFRDSAVGIGKDIQQTDNKEHSNKPILGLDAEAIHDVITCTLDILDTTFDRILLLVMGLGLIVRDTIHT